MSLQIIKPYVHVEDANGNPYVGASLYVYTAGTTTPAAIYSDSGLSIALANPLTSDAAGNFPRAYIQAGTYKLRAVTAAGVLIWTEDNIDTGLSAGTGALPVSRGGTGATTAAAARAILDVPSNSELSDLSTQITAQVLAIQAQLTGIVAAPQGYLTLTSGVPIILADVLAATTVYYTPFIGSVTPIYDGAKFASTSLTEMSLSLVANHVASNIYDAFVALDSTNANAPFIGTGPNWNNAAAGAGSRGSGGGTTELENVLGIWVNKNSITLRNGSTLYTIAARQATFVGSIFMDGTNGQVSCHLSYGQSRKWGISNAYNRRLKVLKAGDGTATWGYTTATYRAANNNAANSITVFQCLPEYPYEFESQGYATNGSSPVSINSAVGFNSTSVASGFDAPSGLTTSASQSARGRFATVPSLGINTVTLLEKSEAAGTTTWNGTETRNLLIARMWA